MALADESDPKEVARRLSALPWVEYAEVDRRVELHGAIPDDPLFARQWSMQNTGQPYWHVQSVPGDNNDTLTERTGTPGADVRMLTAHNHTGPRATVIVGVIDTGIDPEHPDLRDHVWRNPGEIPGNGLDDDHNGFVDDVDGWDFSGDISATPLDLTADNNVRDDVGHGTHVAGIIGAVPDNGVGIAGVCASARIFCAKNFPNSFFSVSAQAIYYCVARGAQVINMSWGGAFRSRALEDALQYAHARGVVLVCSMGNSGQDEVFYPSGYPTTIGVGASTADDREATFATYNDFIDFTAPGQEILSLRAAGTDLYADAGEAGSYIVQGNYLIASGTSMSAPHASGAAAVLLSLAPGLDNERVRNILRSTADDIVDPYGTGENYPGYDRFTGAGRINLERAIAALPGTFVAITEPQPYTWVRGPVVITGSAYGPAFGGYLVSVASGHTPSETDWSIVAQSNKPVSNGTIAEWDNGQLRGPYTLRVDAGHDAVREIRITLHGDVDVAITSPRPGDTIRLLSAVIGTAAGHGFASYELTASGPFPATTSRRIALSTRPLWDDTLAIWRTDPLPEGDYLLSLRLSSDSASPVFSVPVTVASPFADGWPVPLQGVSHFAVTAVNLDGAGDDEIVCATQRGMMVLRYDGTAYPGWPRDTLPDVTSPAAIADLDFDGKFEIIVPGDSLMYIYAFIGEQYAGWPQPFERVYNIYGGALPTVGNVDGRGALEILAIDRFGVIQVWNADGTEYRPQDGGSFGSVANANSVQTWLPSASVCDLDNDGRPELIAAADNILIFDGRTAKPYRENPSATIASHHSVLGMVIGNFVGGPEREIAYAATDASSSDIFFTMIDARGTVLPGWPRSIPHTLDRYLLYALSAGDIDGDGSPEIFGAPYSLDEGYLYAFHANGAPVGSDSTNGLLATLPGAASSVAILDIDDDDEPEIVLRVGSILTGPDRVFAFEADGSLVSGYPLTFGFGSVITPATPIIADLNRDGRTDMVTLQSTDRLLALWKLPTPMDYAVRPWPKFRGDSWNTAVLADPHYDIIYVTKLVVAMLRGGPQLPPYEPSDLNCDGAIAVADIVRLIDYLFRFGPAPCVP